MGSGSLMCTKSEKWKWEHESCRCAEELYFGVGMPTWSESGWHGGDQVSMMKFYRRGSATLA